jgi:hypothetical protein
VVLLGPGRYRDSNADIIARPVNNDCYRVERRPESHTIKCRKCKGIGELRSMNLETIRDLSHASNSETIACPNVIEEDRNLARGVTALALFTVEAVSERHFR